MKIKKPEYYLKIAVLGDAGVGKTSLCTRLTKDYFCPGYELTVGLQIHSYVASLKGQSQHILLYDVAGQPRFGEMLDVFIRGSVGVILVYDCSSILTFLSIEDIWLPFIRKNLPNVPIVLVASKSDQEDFKEVSESQVEALLLVLGDEFNFVSVINTSAKIGTNVKDMIHEIVAVCEMHPLFRILGSNNSVRKDEYLERVSSMEPLGLSNIPPSYNRQTLTNSKTEEE
ncbi:MAG: Rab family GTPase [Candidatus Hodarchaeota archaeon]